MTAVKRMVLDILKPHKPNALDFARSLADLGAGYVVKVDVQEMDEKTESIEVVIEGEDIEYEAIADAIRNLGGSVHSIDQVEVHNLGDGD